MKTSKELLEGDSEIIIFGAGYIGYSTSAFFAKKGISSILIDIDIEKVNTINQGNPPYNDMKTWLGFDIEQFSQLIKATSDWHKIISKGNPVYFIAVNTELNGEPWEEALKDVCSKIAKDPNQPLIIVESTVAPGWTDKIIKPILGSKSKVIIAPRRDWFTLPGMTVETLDRVIGSTNKKALEEAYDILSIVSSKIHKASDYRISEMVKAVENAYRQVGISLSYQLSLAYPNLDIREVLELCSTKWNMDNYYPSIGIGGYCIPIAPKYVMFGTDSPISIFKESMETERLMPEIIAENLLKHDIRSVCILGIAYKGNLKVHVSSASLRLARILLDKGFEVGINDPLYTKDELLKLSSALILDFPDEIYGFDCVIVACDHNQYKAILKEKLYESLKGCKKILDCFGIWSELKSKFKKMGIEYHIVGDKNWL